MVGKVAGEVNTSGSTTVPLAEAEKREDSRGRGSWSGRPFSWVPTGVTGSVCPNLLFSNTCDTFYSALVSIRLPMAGADIRQPGFKPRQAPVPATEGNAHDGESAHRGYHVGGAGRRRAPRRVTSTCLFSCQRAILPTLVKRAD